MPQSTTSLRAWTIVPLLCVTALSACHDEIDMTRPEVERGTLGEELYRQLERDLARTRVNAAAKAEAFRAQRDDFIWAVDTLLPGDTIDQLDGLTTDLLPLVDDDRLPDLIRKLAFIYDDIIASPDIVASWERDERLRKGLSHETANSELIERILSYPRLRELTEFTIDLILEHDGIGADGRPDPRENDFMARLFRSARDQLLAPADPLDLQRNVVVATELALAIDPRFSMNVQVAPMWGVRPDARGLPMVEREADGTLPVLFVDTDGDRLPDTDVEGAFLTRSGTPFVLEPYAVPFDVRQVEGVTFGRDELGRAFLPDGDYVYEYVDLNDTPLGYVLRRTPELVDRGILTDTFIGLEGLLGELDRSGEYPHFGTNNAVLDLLDAAFQVGEFDGLPALLEGVSLLLRDHEGSFADLVVVIDDNTEINASYDAHLEPDSAMLDDLLPYLYELSQYKGLLDDLLTALQDPMMEPLFVGLSDLQYFSNPAIRPPLDGTYNRSVQSCLDDYAVGTIARFDCLRAGDRSEIVTGVVDHTASELDGNVSLQQRLLHLIYDGSGVPFHMEIVELTVPLLGDVTDLATDVGPLLTIPDVAAAFFDSVAGNFCLVDYINVDRIEANGLLSSVLEIANFFGLGSGDTAQTITDLVVFLSDNLGVHLDECPTPGQLIRFFNLPSYELEVFGAYARLADAVDREGYLFRLHHADSLFAAEALGAVDGLQPILQPISDRGLSPLLAELIAAVYRHYPEPDVRYFDVDHEPLDFVYSGLRRYEAPLIEIYDDGRMLAVLQDLLGAVQQLELSREEVPGEVLEELLAHLLDPNAGVMGRNGESTHVREDGASTAMTRFYLLLDAMDALDGSLEDQPEAREAWDRASTELVDLLFEVEELPDGHGRFADRGSPALGSVLAGHLARHLRGYLDSGELFRRLREDYPDYVEDLISSRGFAAIVEMIHAVRTDPADQALFDDFMGYLTDASDVTTRTGLGLIYQLLLDTSDSVGYVQVAPFYAHMIDPDRRFSVDSTPELPLLTHVASVLDEMLAADPDDIGIDLLRRGLIRPEGADEAPLAVLARIIRQVHRSTPGQEGPMSAADMAHLYTSLAAFIRDDFRGIERIMHHIQDRHGVSGQ